MSRKNSIAPDAGNRVAPRWWAPTLAGGIAVALVAYGAVMLHRVANDPDLIFLRSLDGAEWLVLDRPPTLGVGPQGRSEAAFRTRLEIAEQPSRAILTVAALRSAAVLVDGEPLLPPAEDLTRWKQSREIDLSPRLTPGSHELVIFVHNQAGPCAALASASTLGVASGPEWEATANGRDWSPARLASATNPATLGRDFMRADHALLSRLPLLAPIFLGIFAWTFVVGRSAGPPHRLVRAVPSVATLRWLLIGAWIVLAVNNLIRLPPHLGFDFNGHIDYVRYVAEQRSLPLATDGWQMFQSPLYYIVSAPIFAVLDGRVAPESVLRALRVVPLVCGVAQVEICYRALRHVFPARDDLQRVGLVIGGLLPVNLYMSQSLGNEPLAACLAGITLVLTLRYVRRLEYAPRAAIVIGLFLGLAMLAKVTPVLLAPAIAVALVYTVVARPAAEKPTMFPRAAILVGCSLGTAAVVSGWYYVRNWIELGAPFVGGWESGRGFDWWSDPGYRTWSQLVPTAEAWTYPIYAPVVGFWDGLYSTLWLDGFLSGAVYEEQPPWDYGFMLGGAWLSILPALALAAGLFALRGRRGAEERPGLAVAIGSLGIFALASLHHFITLPSFAAAKAFYALSALPCLALVSAAGFDLFVRRPLPRALAYSWLACWAAAAYLAYFVR